MDPSEGLEVKRTDILPFVTSRNEIPNNSSRSCVSSQTDCTVWMTQRPIKSKGTEDSGHDGGVRGTNLVVIEERRGRPSSRL